MKYYLELTVTFLITVLIFFRDYYINPIDPAVNPTTRKKANSSKSLGKELTIKLN